MVAPVNAKYFGRWLDGTTSVMYSWVIGALPPNAPVINLYNNNIVPNNENKTLGRRPYYYIDNIFYNVKKKRKKRKTQWFQKMHIFSFVFSLQ